ncbi:MAG: hypothetical protein JWO79_1206 [Actinomycetia bacterium]|nr:hypothetical protein [Actinomycetes bacterium]
MRNSGKLGIATVSVVAIGLIGPTQAGAADAAHYAAPPTGKVTTTCYGQSCQGLDPTAAGCNADAFAITGTLVKTYTSNVPMAQVDVYYSPSCHAGWGESVDKSGGASFYTSIAIYSGPAGGAFNTVAPRKMINWDNSIKMCVTTGETPQGTEDLDPMMAAYDTGQPASAFGGCSPWS